MPPPSPTPPRPDRRGRRNWPALERRRMRGLAGRWSPLHGGRCGGGPGRRRASCGSLARRVAGGDLFRRHPGRGPGRPRPAGAARDRLGRGTGSRPPSCWTRRSLGDPRRPTSTTRCTCSRKRGRDRSKRRTWCCFSRTRSRGWPSSGSWRRWAAGQRCGLCRGGRLRSRTARRAGLGRSARRRGGTLGVVVPGGAAGGDRLGSAGAGSRAPWLRIGECRSRWVDELGGEPALDWVRRQLGLSASAAIEPHLDRLTVRLRPSSSARDEEGVDARRGRPWPTSSATSSDSTRSAERSRCPPGSNRAGSWPSRCPIRTMPGRVCGWPRRGCRLRQVRGPEGSCRARDAALHVG